LRERLHGAPWMLAKKVKSMDKAIAKQISALMLEYGAKLDESISLVMAHCTEDELKRYRQSVGHILGYMLLEIMNPLYKEYPDLKPPELK
jgi:type II secretory pathway component PulF